MTQLQSPCKTCRLRHVKCDRTKPVCQRCRGSGRICLQKTSKHQNFAIHIENQYANGEIKRPRGPRSMLKASQCSIDIKSTALAYYLQCYSFDSDAVMARSGWSECISSWYKYGRLNSMVDMAFESMALSIFSGIHNSVEASSQAGKTYLGLLRTVHNSISRLKNSDMESQEIDACLLTIFFMSRYEVSSYRSQHQTSSSFFRSLKSWVHHDGALAVLKMWYDNPIKLPVTNILRQTRRGLIRSHLLRDRVLPDWLLDGSQFGEYGLDFTIDNILVRINNLHHKVGNLMVNEPAEHDICQLDRQMDNLENDLQCYAAYILKPWVSSSHTLENRDHPWTRHVHPSQWSSLSDTTDTVDWTHYVAMRMLIKSMHITISSNYPSDSSYFPIEKLENVRIDMKALANSLSACIPHYHIQNTSVYSNIAEDDIDFKFSYKHSAQMHLANFAVWPLTIAAHVKGIETNQQHWFRCELASVGRALGGGVIGYADSDQWPTL